MPTTKKPSTPAVVGYMRLRDGISAAHKRDYKALLKQNGATRIVDEAVGEFGVRPKFDRLLKSLGANGTIVIVRESHLSANPVISSGLSGRIANAGVKLAVLKPADAGSTMRVGGVVREGDGGGNG